MTTYDYVIVGGGTAGCVLAHRLSADPGTTVLLIEAGDRDDDPRIDMPRGFGELIGDPSRAWHYPTRPVGPDARVEHWVRGRTLGGSSSVNGMVYNRGQGPDWDDVASVGGPGWSWDAMLPAFQEIEEHLGISSATDDDPLLEDVLDAGTALGWERAPDPNAHDGERIGYSMATICDGRRSSASAAFLHPVLERANLTLSLRTSIDEVVVHDGHAVGVRGRQDGRRIAHRAAREVILSAGTIATPGILERSGIGGHRALQEAGIEQLVDSPHVGERMREHRVVTVQVRLTEDLGYNRLLSTPEGLAEALEEYRSRGGGPLGAPAFDLIGFFRTRAGLERPDAQLQIAPYSIRPPEQGRELGVEEAPGLMAIGYPLRPDSTGSVHLASADPAQMPTIDPGYLATEHDRSITADVVTTLRRLLATEPIASRIAHETAPGPAVQSDAEIVHAALTTGGSGYHAIGTTAMGPREDDVVDERLQVRGVGSLRVVDASVLPVMVSGNLNGPVTALAWRAADLIIDAA